jgi:hypothetical protein
MKWSAGETSIRQSWACFASITAASHTAAAVLRPLGFQIELDILPAFMRELQANDLSLGSIGHHGHPLQRDPGQEAFDGGL